MFSDSVRMSLQYGANCLSKKVNKYSRAITMCVERSTRYSGRQWDISVDEEGGEIVWPMEPRPVCPTDCYSLLLCPSQEPIFVALD
mgnify:CR=1 FL=1